MRWPFLTRNEHDDTVTILLKRINDLERRLKDVERQFVTKYAENGAIAETLADVPVNERQNIKVIKRPKNPMAGMSWPQRREWLERTEGGKKLG